MESRPRLARTGSRWWKVVLGLVVALVVVFYGTGGWVFSEMIHDDALTPQPPTPDKGVWVRAVDGERIILTSEEVREDTTRPGLAGLAWEGGYGVIGEIETIDDLDVTRSFRLVTGTPPAHCVNALAGCDPVDIEGWTFQTDPHDVGLEFADITYDTPLGPMAAWRIDAGEGATWAIHVHGWRSSRREALRSLPIYATSGVTSLVVDYRNDPESPADPSGLYRFGRTEWEDLEGAVGYALDNGAEEVVLVGYSTGAAVSLALLEGSSLAGQVSALVLDSPNADMGATVRFAASKETLPGTSVPVPSSLATVAMWVANLRWDVDWEEIDYVSRASGFLRVPTLVFHGLNDDRVPVEVSRRLEAQAPELVELVEVEDAGHVTSWNVDPLLYSEVVTDFLEERGLTEGGI